LEAASKDSSDSLKPFSSVPAMKRRMPVPHQCNMILVEVRMRVDVINGMLDQELIIQALLVLGVVCYAGQQFTVPFSSWSPKSVAA
jgi:hypothetical protein